MANAVFVRKPNSPYDDTEERYHFPQQYLKRVQQTLGDQIIYYGLEDRKEGRFYQAIATVVAIEPDQHKKDHYYALMRGQLNFDTPVYYLDNGGYEHKLIMPEGKVNGGTAQSAVRLITPEEFSKIVSAGFSVETAWPERNENIEILNPEHSLIGFSEAAAPLFIERAIIPTVYDRKFRDRKFRQQVLDAYDRRCAFTGLRLINGGGRPEVEAAHIVPVEKNGSDSPRNGIALSGTAHWMFDRGLLSLADDFTILKSRHLNYEIDHLLNKTGKAIVPTILKLQPHPQYLQWHRENCFKV